MGCAAPITWTSSPSETNIEPSPFAADSSIFSYLTAVKCETSREGSGKGGWRWMKGSVTSVGGQGRAVKRAVGGEGKAVKERRDVKGRQ